MLQLLRVKNLAIVENLRMEFGKGLNVITGETGAGKSIIAGALGLVLGGRADKTMIRAGEETCGVEATFQLADPSDVDALLDELGIEPCEDGRLIIRRIISASGSGKNLVNDCPCTLQVMKRVGDLLVDMHGPHDHQSLLSQGFQVDLLDSFGHIWKTRGGYEAVHAQVLELERRARELDGDDQAVAEKIDMLAFQIKEIEDAGLDGTDEEDLRQEHATVANAQRLIELGDGVCRALTEDDACAFGSMRFVQTALDEMSDVYTEAAEWHEEAKGIAIQLQELSQTIAAAVQNIEADPERLQWLDDRLASLQKLKRKYGGTVAEIIEFLEGAQEQLQELETRGERIAEINSRLAACTQQRETAGNKLSTERATAGKKLATAITGELRDLGFPHGTFDVQLTSAEPGPSGMDAIEFGFAPNVGEPMRPLRAIASSGEISRVMLASKTILADHDRIPVLLFDEIDANVGGEMGNAIGQKLAKVAETHQVLCITHLPQVAAHGREHFVVSKSVSGDRTRTQVDAVSGDERVAELGRMLGGRDLTDTARRHAREMLDDKSPTD